MLSDMWSVEESSTEIFGTTVFVETKVGLDDMSVISCFDDECTTVEDDISNAYDNCTTLAADMEFNASETEDACGPIGDMATAGTTGMIFITLGIIVLLVSLVSTFLGMKGTTLPFSQFYSLGGVGFTLLGVVAWWLIMPEPPEDSNPSLGLSAWMVIASIVLSGVGSALSLFKTNSSTINGGTAQSHIVSSRVPGIGVRTLTSKSKSKEFVLRESAMGNTTLSLIDDGKLLRLVSAQKVAEDVVVEDRFITKKPAFTGFTHHRYDWLDSGKYAWWLITAIGFISLILSPSGGSFLFMVGALLTLAQFFDPELLYFETNAGRHRLLLYRYGSNRELMNYSMDQIDSIMQEMLSGGELDGTSVETKAAEIEENRAAEIKLIQDAAAAAAAAELAQAATPPLVLPTPQPPPNHNAQPAEVVVNQQQPAPAPPPTPMEVPEQVPPSPAPPAAPAAQAPLPPPAPPQPQAQALPPPPPAPPAPAPAPPVQQTQPCRLHQQPKLYHH